MTVEHEELLLGSSRVWKHSGQACMWCVETRGRHSEHANVRPPLRRGQLGPYSSGDLSYSKASVGTI